MSTPGAKPVRPRRRAVLLGAVAGLVLAAPVAAEPALWSVHGPAGGVVYLFGTVHILRKGTVWRSPRIARALAESRDLWLEIDDPGGGATQALMVRYGLDAQHPLSTKLPAAEIAQLDGAAKAAGLPGEAALEPMRPWLAGLTVSLAPVLQAGFDPGGGVDKVLTAEARARGEPIIAFETGEQQIRFFADLPPKLERDLLDASLKDVADGPAKVDALVAAWLKGDVNALARLEDEDLRRETPELYRLLIVRRNAAWAARLATRLKQPGVSFVAVGAGHLAGPGSVQHQLERLGYRVERR